MNIGFLGCSKIADKAIKALRTIEGVVLYGCSAQDYNRAIVFQEKYNILHAYNSYEEMLRDKNIDLIYISTLTSSHYKDTMLALKHNKHCIVEKPIARTIKETNEILFYSEKHNLFVTEALVGRFHPSRAIIKDLLNKDVIGKPYHIEANLSYPLKDVPRLNNVEMGGGVLFDLGVYPLNFMTMFFGYKIKNISSIQVIDKDTKIDRSDFISVVYEDGKTAQLTVSLEGLSNKKGVIYGSEGHIEVDNFSNPSMIKIYKNVTNRNSELIHEVPIKDVTNGYEFEFQRSIEAINSYQIESDEFMHYEILEIMKIIENINKNSVKVEI